MSTFTNWTRSLNGPPLFGPGAPTYFRASSPGAFATPKLVNSGNTDTAALATTITFLYPNAGAIGDTIVVQVGWATAAITISTIADTAGNTYTLQANSAQTGAIVSIYICKVTVGFAAAANTLTVTFSSTGSTLRSLTVAEFSGVDATYGVAAFSGLATATSALANGGSVSAYDGGLILSGVYAASGTATTPPGYTLFGVPTGSDGMAYQNAVLAAPQNPSWVLSGSAVWIAWNLVLRSAILGTGSPSPSGSGTAPIVYQDKVAQWQAMVRSSIAAPVVNVEALMPGDNPPANWVLLSALTVPAGLSVTFQFFGPVLAARLNWASAGAGAVVIGDLMWQEFEFY